MCNMDKLYYLHCVADEVLVSEDNTGCSEDLTVVSKEAIENLRAAVEILRGVVHKP